MVTRKQVASALFLGLALGILAYGAWRGGTRMPEPTPLPEPPPPPGPEPTPPDMTGPGPLPGQALPGPAQEPPPPEPKPPTRPIRMGTVSINAVPWAEVWMEGERKGETPIELRLPAGEHSITLAHEQMRVIKRVTVEPGRNESVTHSW
jgi:hypothetical protein